MSDDDRSSDWLIDAGSDPADTAVRYDGWADDYDRDLESWGYRAPDVVARLVMAARPGAATVLDAGCGTGLAGRALRQAGYEGAIHGLDVSTASLEHADRGRVYTTLRTADLQQPLDLPDDGMDVLVCVGVMTYLPEVEAIWREFSRTAAPGGLVVVTQREDLWHERDCQGVVDRLIADDTWVNAEVTGPEPYLPDNAEGMGPIGVYYVAARVA